MPATEKQKEYNKKYSQKRYRERLEKGLCCYCDNPREGDRVRCSSCREITSDYCAGRYDIRKVRGLCVDCGKTKPRPNRVTCQQCAERKKLQKPNEGESPKLIETKV